MDESFIKIPQGALEEKIYLKDIISVTTDGHYLEINKDDVYVVGDSGNDITMFNKFHEHSYCMKRGHPSARKYAKHIITRVYKLEKLILRGENHE